MIMSPLFIVEEEIQSFLPESFVANHFNSPWQERTIMGIWMFLLFGYILSMAPILFLSAFFWLLAVEWSLETTLFFAPSLEEEEEEEDSVHSDMDNHENKQFCVLMDRLARNDKIEEGFLDRIHMMGLFRFSAESFLDDKTEKDEQPTIGAREKGLDATHYHRDIPPLAKAEWSNEF
jgi:hypothetical protein